MDIFSKIRATTLAPELDGKVTMLLNTDWETFGSNTKRSIYKSIPDAILAFSGILFSLHE